MWSKVNRSHPYSKYNFVTCAYNSVAGYFNSLAVIPQCGVPRWAINGNVPHLSGLLSSLPPLSAGKLLMWGQMPLSGNVWELTLTVLYLHYYVNDSHVFLPTGCWWKMGSTSLGKKYDMELWWGAINAVTSQLDNNLDSKASSTFGDWGGNDLRYGCLLWST